MTPVAGSIAIEAPWLTLFVSLILTGVPHEAPQSLEDEK